MSGYVISYDVGTTGMKTCLFKIDTTIDLIASDIADYDLKVLENGGVEQDPEDWFRAMCQTTIQVMAQSNLRADEISGLSFCAQMQGLVLVDQEGRAIRPAMSYMDNRAYQEHAEGLSHGVKIAGMNVKKLTKSLQVTGAVPASIKDPLWKYKWVEKNEPHIFKKIYRWLDIKEYLIARLTGRFVMTEDSAFATMLFDLKDKIFSKDICQLYGVDYEHLPKVVKSTDLVGGIKDDVAKLLGLKAGIPVFGGGGDASLVGIGAGAVDINDTHVYIGTSGWVSTVVDKRLVDLSAMIASIQGANPESYIYFAELETAGKCLEWVKDHLALDEIGVYLKKHQDLHNTEEVHESLYDFMMQAIKDVPPGSNGVIFTPWLHGNRCPFEDHKARGMFFNLGLDNGKRDMIHSVIEGVCYHLKWQLEATEKKTNTNEVIRFVGGGALADKTCQILSDILNRPIETVDNPQNIGSVGAAIIAGIGLDFIPSLHHAKSLIRRQKLYLPRQDHALMYDDQFKVFKSLYTNNKKAFESLN